MATSGTYTFQNTAFDQFLSEAFERVGILPDLITGNMIQTAIRSGNLILSSWINRGLNQWTVRQEILGLITNKSAYTLPTGTSAILEANIRTSSRPLGGTAFSSAGGTAANAFDANTATACTQTAPNGYISYNYGTNVTYTVAMVGILSNATLTYTLNFEYSSDNVTWTLAYAPVAQTYTQGSLLWFVIPVPTPAQYFRVRESGGATLNVQELYFNTTVQDTPMTAISRSEYVSMPIKTQTGRPTSYYLDRQINPVVYLWPTPSFLYNAIYYTRVVEMQDIIALINQAEIPWRFFDALCAQLAYTVAIKFKPEKAEMLKAIADESFSEAAREDIERVPVRIYPDYLSTSWGRVT